MKKICGNCCFWEQYYSDNYVLDTGFCNSDMFSNVFYKGVNIDGCGYYDCEEPEKIYLKTGKNFGCIHYRNRL